MSVVSTAVGLRGNVLGAAVAQAAIAALAAAVPACVVAYVMDRALSRTTSPRELVLAALVLVAALALRSIMGSAAGRLARRALNEYAERLRVRVLDGLGRIPAHRLRELDAGRVVAILTTGIDEAFGVFGDAFDAIFGGITTALIVLALLAWIDWRIALLALAFLPVTAGYLWQSRAISARAAPRLVRARAEGTSRFFEYVESVALLRTFGRTAERAARLAWALQELKIKAFETSIAPIPFGVLALFFIEFGFAITVMVATEANAATTGFAVTRYLLALIVALGYFQTLFDATDAYLRLRDARSGLLEVERLLELCAAAGPAAGELPQRHDVELDHVSFGYDRGPVLEDISYRFAQRGVTAVVGRSGAGKSVLAGLIAGLNEPAGGRVLIGGVDLRTLSAHDRARTVTLVFQDTELIEGTIAENIAAGRPGVSEAEIRAAARTANCDEFVSRLAGGYGAMVRPGAVNLSLGERQRVAIARALIGNAPIVVFDECTASLDPAAERAIHGAIEQLAHRAAVVLITHRLGTVRNVQRIVVLADHRIADSGNHASLLKRNGEYARLWSAYEAARTWHVAS